MGDLEGVVGESGAARTLSHERGDVPRGHATARHRKFGNRWLAFVGSGGPLLVLFYGFPVWWLLGLSNFVFFGAALVMGTYLAHLGSRVRIPAGFWLWALFLSAVLISALTLKAQAPNSVPGDTGNILSFGYRLAWYLSLTVLLLYAGNLAEDRAPTRKLVRAAGFMFVMIVAGGVLGVLAPTWEARSLVEILLPDSLASNGFMLSLVHLQAADLQSIVSETDVRPKAPFPYANTLGAALAAYLPFFVYAWMGPGAGRRKYAALVVLPIATGVAVASLNRTLWVSLAIVGAYAGIQSVRLLGPKAIAPILAVCALAGVALIATGAQDYMAERFAAGHSNDRRGDLASVTVDSVLSGSPIIGFGNTRSVQGSFASIAGGATPECPKCEVPQMGTQGHFWNILFCQGLVGVLSFTAFIAYRIWRHLPSRQLLVVTLLAAPIFALLQMPFYDILGAPLAAVMLALALMWRSEMGRPQGVRNG